MTHKLEIKWENSNPVFESVRIYKSNVAFTENNLPPILVEITDINVSTYDDLNVELGDKFFYMLSIKLGVSEAYSECFSIDIVENIANTLAITFVSSVPSIPSEWDTFGSFRMHKGGFPDSSINASVNSLKYYALPYRRSADGSYYYEIICTKAYNSQGVAQANLLQDNLIGLMQSGASMTVNSAGNSGSTNFDNAGYGRYLLRNNISSNSIEGAGGGLSSGGTWYTKLSNQKINFGDVVGFGIKANGANTQIHLWINGVYKGVLFNVAGSATDLRPLIIFTLEPSSLKSTHYQCPRNLNFLPDGYQSWLTVS